MIDSKIHKYIERERSRPFIWGQNDCNTFVLKFLDRIHNLDLEQSIKGKYKTEFGAIKFQKKFGQYLSEYLINNGGRKILPTMAVTGDILIIKKGVYELGHICLGHLIAGCLENKSISIGRIQDFKKFDLAIRFDHA
tara:strand:- start:1 stop:411 length:411 start_codon:yes stop_codon:yes gene_type:complete